MRILISGRNTLIPFGIQKMLSETRHKVLSNEYHTVEQLAARIILEQTDLVILDKTSAEDLTINDLAELRNRIPRLKIVMISTLDFSEFIQQAIAFGVEGYLTYDCSADEMNELIADIQKGGKYYCQKVLSQLLPKIASPSTEPEKSLTERELEIARLIASGNTNKIIGELLCISPHTVHTHRKSMMRKLNISSAREVTLYILSKEGHIPL